MLNFKDHKKTIFQTPKIDDHMSAKSLPCLRISKASL